MYGTKNHSHNVKQGKTNNATSNGKYQDKKFMKPKTNFITTNKFAPLADSENEEPEEVDSKKEQVFREDPSKIGETLAAIMTLLDL